MRDRDLVSSEMPCYTYRSASFPEIQGGRSLFNVLTHRRGVDEHNDLRQHTKLIGARISLDGSDWSKRQLHGFAVQDGDLRSVVKAIFQHLRQFGVAEGNVFPEVPGVRSACGLLCLKSK